MNFVRVIAFLLMSNLLVITIRPSIQIISFYKNQADIIKSHCVNKNKPELQCEGHCYLKKQLRVHKNESESPALPEVSIFIPQAFENIETVQYEPLAYYSPDRLFYFYLVQRPSTYTGEVFTPPKLII